MSLITYITRIHFADRVLEDALAVETDRNRIHRPLIVTEPLPTEDDGLSRLLDALPVEADPLHLETETAAPPDAELARMSCQFGEAERDGIIAFGGATAIDLARCLGETGVPVIGVPTATDTIGLGPLVGDLAARPGHRPPVPVAILCDPTLTTASGPVATAASGMRVMTRCLESYLSRAFNPPADGIALDGLRRAATALEAAVADGADLDARRELLAAALDAGLAAEKGLGGIEAAARGLEATTRNGRGAFHGALLTEVLAFNAPAIDHRFGPIRTSLGLVEGTDLAGHLTALARRVRLPLQLSQAGVEAHVLPHAAGRAALDPANRTNPRLATAEDYERMLRATL